MQVTLLQAIAHIAKNPVYELMQNYGRNRINSVGDALERFIQDSFAGTLNETDEARRAEKLESTFSYRATQNNPPDLIIRNGDAVEVKKVQSLGAAIALNSSFPKSKLYADDPLITAKCRTCEAWTEKDIIYAVGFTTDTSLRHLWLVYGDCYAARPEVYSRIKTTISEGVNAIPGVEFAATRELGRINKVDHLGITNLRVRGMWHIDNPHRVFDYIYQPAEETSFALACLIRRSKFASFSRGEREELEQLPLQIKEVEIKDPDNPEQLIDAVLIVFEVKS